MIKGAMEQMVEELAEQIRASNIGNNPNYELKTALGTLLTEARRLLSEEQAKKENRPAVTMREADLADWKEHKEEFKKWMEQKPPMIIADEKGNIIPSKHYKCPKCHTRFTREYPYKPSDTKEVKPTAPASLVEAMEKWGNEYWGGIEAPGYKKFFEILSRYRPAPASEEGFNEETFNALKELYAQVKGECPRLLDEDSGSDAQLDLWISRIIKHGFSRHHSPEVKGESVNPCAELVRELKTWFEWFEEEDMPHSVAMDFEEILAKYDRGEAKKEGL